MCFQSELLGRLLTPSFIAPQTRFSCIFLCLSGIPPVLSVDCMDAGSTGADGSVAPFKIRHYKNHKSILKSCNGFPFLTGI